MSRRIVVTGGRDYYDYRDMEPLLADVMSEGDTLVHGDAAGCDRLCEQAWDIVCETLGWPHNVHRFPADWKGQGAAAGGIRNQAMLDSGLDGVIVFPGGRGTADMRRRCERAGIMVIVAAEWKRHQ